jgi:hypothetical protein
MREEEEDEGFITFKPKDDDDENDDDEDANTSRSSRSQATPERRRKKGCRRLQFADPLHVVAYIPAIEDLTRTERHAVWWRQKDFGGFRQAAKVVAYQARHTCKRLETAGYPLAVSWQTQDDLRHVPSELAEWSAGAARGLEHWTSRTHYELRRKAIDNAKKQVLQQKASAEECQDATRASRVLARFLGEADAVCAAQSHERIQQQCKQPNSTTTSSSPERKVKYYQERKLPAQHRGIA